MGCCGGKDDVADKNTEAAAVAPPTNRKCRDVLCIVIFAVYWVGMVIVTIVGLKQGDPYRLLFATDFNGTTCGAKEMVDKPLIYYPRINDDLLSAAQGGVNPLDADFYGYCVKECPKLGTYSCNYAKEAEIQSAHTLPADQEAARKKEATKFFGEKNCWFVPLESDIVFFRCLPAANVNTTATEKCVYPADNATYYDIVNNVSIPNKLCELKEVTTVSVRKAQAQDNPLFDKLQSTAQLIGRYMGDIRETYTLIFALGGGLALVGGCVILLLLRFCAGCIIWSVCYGLLLLTAAFSLVMSFRAGFIKNSHVQELSKQLAAADLSSGGDTQVPAALLADEKKLEFYQAAAVLSYVLLVIVLLVVCFMRKKIKIMIGIMREASKAVGRLPFLVIFPVFPFVVILILFMYWVVIAAFIYSSGGIEAHQLTSQASSTLGTDAVNSTEAATAVQALKPSQTMRIMFLYHFFGFLWTNQLVQAVSMTTMAGAFCRYYWSREKTSEEMGRFPILSSFKNCFRYHLGSLIFGSFLIALVQLIRAILMYIDRQTKKIQEANLMVKVALKVVQCCLWCLEKCMKFISKNAYIIIAMKGKSFCAAARDAFMVILTNAAQVAIIAAISNVVLLLAKVVITLGCTTLMFTIIEKDPKYDIGGEKELSSPIFPVALTALMAWFVSSSFMSVYGMAIDTILLCFCEDRKINQTSGNYYMSEELQKFVDSTAKKGD